MCRFNEFDSNEKRVEIISVNAYMSYDGMHIFITITRIQMLRTNLSFIRGHVCP